MILFLAIIFAVLSIMQFFYNMIRLFVSRDRELRADAIAVRLTRDPLSLSEALYSISRGWRGLGYIDNNLESLFIINPARKIADESDSFWANMMSTHPPIDKRMAILARMAHSDVKNIQEKIVSQEKLRDRLREEPHEKKELRWMLMDNEKAWKGPFSIPQMMLLGWVRPDTWIKAIDHDTVIQAKDEALFRPLFDDKVSGLQKASINCPKCDQALVTEEYEGTNIKRCVFCKGVIVEKGKMPRIIIREKKGFNERIAKLAELAQKNGLDKMRSRAKDRSGSLLKCPKCGKSMMRNFYTMAYLVEIDSCNFCNLIWFDSDELEMVQYLIENKKAAKVIV